MSNVVNVVGRKRVEARGALIRRALGTELVTGGIYVYKHSIVIDSSVAFPQPQAEAHDRTTYDINDITPAAVPSGGALPSSAAGARVEGLFMDAPRWLMRQVEKCRERPRAEMHRCLVEAVRAQVAFDLHPEEAEIDPASNKLVGSPASALNEADVPTHAEIEREVRKWL